jgi:hypothetical protein
MGGNKPSRIAFARRVAERVALLSEKVAYFQFGDIRADYFVQLCL